MENSIYAPDFHNRFMAKLKFVQLAVCIAVTAIFIASAVSIIVKMLLTIILLFCTLYTFFDFAYYYKIYQNPIIVNPIERTLKYYDGVRLKNITLNIDLLESIEPYSKKSKPYILELKYADKIENINVQAFSKETVCLLLVKLLSLKKNIKISREGDSFSFEKKKKPVRSLK